jgi:hypothetical protein
VTDEVTASYLGDTYRFTWDVGITLEMARFTESSRDGLGCEIVVTSSIPPSPGLLHQARFNMMSTQARKTLSTALSAREPGVDFPALLEYACFHAIRQWRDGDPIINLWEVEARPAGRMFVDLFIEHGGPTTLYGDGGTGKSLLAMAIGLSVVADIPLLGAAPNRTGPVLYLDWETDEYTHSERLQALCRGYAGSIFPAALHYRRQQASLTESASYVKREVARLGVVLVIADSLGAARGGDSDSAELTIRTFNAARAFGCPVLFVDHLPKNAKDKSKPFGSVFTHNLSRITWFVERGAKELNGGFVVGLTNQKANNGALAPRLGYQVLMETDESKNLQVVSFRQTKAPAPAVEENAGNRIIAALAEDPARHFSYDDLERVTGVKQSTLRSAMRRLGNDVAKDGSNSFFLVRPDGF